jgi:hypothetical protein
MAAVRVSASLVDKLPDIAKVRVLCVEKIIKHLLFMRVLRRIFKEGSRVFIQS